MVLMESYFFCASVRLGVLVICAAAALKSFTIMWLIFSDGNKFLFAVINVFENYYKTNAIAHSYINWVEQYPRELMMFFQLYSFCHIVSCIIAAFGAYKLKRYHVIPLAIFEFIYTVQIVVVAIFTLRMVRRIVPLATLILLTIILTFYAMLVAYDTLVLVAFIQIMHLVRTERYQRLYGNDPLNPILDGIPQLDLLEGSPNAPNPIIIYVMPKPGQKLWDQQPKKWWQSERNGPQVRKKSLVQEISADYFQREELVSKVLLRNAVNGDYWNPKKVTS
ncbi:uncharacterized protein [Drosophila bipectinata]|uniref:uncharacterized protein n=1 Tax=Drosophila bipectinata TaxID=42026 RepID=UPI001C89B4CD|nr:uncharacterized protein LOC108126612 [Drosophila bipectinata]